jgi:ATP/maltotriose-dependent transcriptional regulator MalT
MEQEMIDTTWERIEAPSSARIEDAVPEPTSARKQLIESLTWRETAVLWLLDAQLSNEEIAAVLHIASGTIERHTSSVSRKLVIRTRHEAVALAHGLRLISSRAPKGASPP